MISRFYLASQEPHITTHRNKWQVGRSYLSGWIILILITTGYLSWIAYRLLVKPAWVIRLPPTFVEILQLADWGLAITLAVLWVGLLWHHTQLSPRSTFQPLNQEQLYELSPEDFERYVAKLYRLKGYQVDHRGRSGDHGVDLELTGEGYKRAIVQCKRYRGTVGEDVVRDLYGTLLHERVSRAFLVTTGDISSAAYNWAEGKPITLIDGMTLVSVAQSLIESL